MFTRAAGARDHLVADFFADANHRACRAIYRSRYAGTPLSGPAFNLPGGKGIQAMHRHHEGYFQLPAEQRGGVAARQSGMGMDHVHGMRTVQAPDLRQQPGEKKGPRAGQTPSPGREKKRTHRAGTAESLPVRRLDKRAALPAPCLPLPTAPAPPAAPPQSSPERRLPAPDRTASRSGRAAVRCER